MLCRIILITLLFLSTASAQELINAPKATMNDIESAQYIVDVAEKVKEQNSYNEEAAKIIQEATKVENNQEYKKHQNWIAQNQQEFFAKQAKPLPKVDYNITEKEIEKDAIAKLLNNYRFKPDDIKKNQITHYPLMIFVSSSIPKDSLKDLMIQAKKSGGVLVFRGMIGGIKNTAKFLANISKDNVSAIIDPRLFDIFKVEVVPTFIVLGESTQECQLGNCLITPKHDRVIGNITLQYALEQVVAGKGDTTKVAETYLKKIKGEQ